MCLLDVIGEGEKTVTISSAFFKRGKQAVNNNCNVWTSNRDKRTEAITALPATIHDSMWNNKECLPDKTTDPVHDYSTETPYNSFTETASTEHQCR